MKQLIESAPIPLTKRPAHPKYKITFYRAQDVISFKLNGKYYAGYVHDNRQNEAPIVEFYDYVSDHKPTMKDLGGVKAKGMGRQDGSIERMKYSIAGMKDLPDYANQIHLIQTSVATPPDNSHLEKGIGDWKHSCLISDIIEIQRYLK